MTIEYMTTVKDNLKINNFINRGFSEEKIQKIESEYNKGNKFPKAFREFLYLAGDFNNFGFDDIEGILKLQELAKEELEITGAKIERPFFVFHQLSGCEYFTFIYLDENTADPKTYICSPYYKSTPGEEFIKYNGFTFTALVNESIHRVKNNIPF